MFDIIVKKIKISVDVDGKHFRITAHQHLYKKWRIKSGRSWSKKVNYLTITEIFELARRWTVKVINEKT